MAYQRHIAELRFKHVYAGYTF